MTPVAAPATSTLAVSDFFARLPEMARRRLPPGLADFHHRRQGRLIKIYFDQPRLHFEAWHHPRTQRLEVGLHLEGSPELNRRGLELLRSRMLEVKESLPLAELEPWDRGWCRLYQTLAAPVLDAELLESTAALLAAYVVALTPILEELESQPGERS